MFIIVYLSYPVQLVNGPLNSAGPAQTAWVGGATGLVGLPWWEGVSVFKALDPPTPTPMLLSRSPSSPTRLTPIILSLLIIHLHLHSSSPGTFLGGGIDGLFPWSSLNYSRQGDSQDLKACPLLTHTLGGGAAQGQGGPLLVVDLELTTGIAMAKHQVQTLT